MKPQFVFLTLLFSLLCFGAGLWLGPKYAFRPNPYLVAMRATEPDLYRSKSASEKVVLKGDASRVREALLKADLLERLSGLASVLQELGPDSLDEVLKAYETVFLDVGDTELVLLADWWARFDPHAAMKWSETEWRADHPIIGMQIMRAWGRLDPGAAMVRAKKGRDRNKTDNALYVLAVVAGWEQNDQLGALSFLQSIGPGMPRQRMMRGLARRRVLRHGIDDAFQFVRSLPDDDRLFKLNLMRRVIGSSVLLDAPKTARLAASLQGGLYFEGLPQRVVIPWVKEDPQAAVLWLSSLEDSESRDDAVREAYRAWAPRDNKGARDWVTGTEHEPWRDHALAIHARQIQLSDYAAGIASAEKIFDKELRQGTLTVIARVWAKYDEAAAAKYVNEADWTEKERNRVMAVEWRERAFVTGELEKEDGIYAKQVRDKMERDLVEDDLAE